MIRCAILSSEPRLVTMVLIRSLMFGKRPDPSRQDCLHSAMVGWIKALFTLSGMRSQANVVAAESYRSLLARRTSENVALKVSIDSLVQIGSHGSRSRTPPGNSGGALLERDTCGDRIGGSTRYLIYLTHGLHFAIFVIQPSQPRTDDPRSARASVVRRPVAR